MFGKVLGVAASSASFILMAADSVEMPENSLMMIHNAWAFAIGDSDDFRKQADTLDKHQDAIVSIYMKRTGLEESIIREMMRIETWMDGKDALELGFVDTITDEVDIAARARGFKSSFNSFPINDDVKNIVTIKILKST